MLKIKVASTCHFVECKWASVLGFDGVEPGLVVAGAAARVEELGWAWEVLSKIRS
jgi:hypothetical protein